MPVPTGALGEAKMLTDPIADMLTRIRNANKAMHERAVMPTSKLKEEIARILKEEGYITDFHVEKGETQTGKDGQPAPLGYDLLVVELKYGRNRERVISNLRRISRPGRRVYAGKDRLPRVLGGMGTAILSTSQGLVTSKTAAERGVGGEVICFVW
jgi:small subunit ribosomal protein S8